MSIGVILLDLDGTLLTSGKALSAANYRALEAAAARGIHIVPATGRFYAGMPQVIRDLPFFRYAVTVNGAQVYDRLEDNVLYRADIAPEAAERVYDLLDGLPVIYDCFLDGWGYMDRRNYDRIDQFITDPHVNSMVKALRRPVDGFRAFMRARNQPVQKIQMFFQDMAARENALAELAELAEKLPDMAVTSSIPNNVEINAKGADKGTALRFLCRCLGIHAADSMAIGDGSNDAGMIKAAGVGVAMGNAHPALKELADEITDTNDRDGVAKAIARFCPELGLAV